MLRFEQVKKQYSSTTVLSVDSLLINKGLVLLQGENGSGKTTLLKIIAGLLPFEGNILFNDTFSLKKQRLQFIRQINYAEAEPIYPEFLTAKELVKLFCYAKKGNVQFIENLLEQLHIIDVYNKPVSTYSSGMIKKLSLALAFAGTPSWILLDEPFITIDKNSVAAICQIINKKYSDDGVSFLITSHQNFNNENLSFTASLLVQDHTVKFAE